jgi:hypothetical protein
MSGGCNTVTVVQRLHPLQFSGDKANLVAW